MIHMEGIIKGGGRVGVGVGVGEVDDMGDGMQCSDHPNRNNPGGICPLCLQEKLGKLVSSSFPLPIRASSSSSSSPSFRSDIAPSSSSITAAPAASSSLAPASSSLSLSAKKNGTTDPYYHHEYYARRPRLPFLLAKRKKKKASANSSSSSVSGAASSSEAILKRSKSTATPRRGSHSLVDAEDDIVIEDFSPRKRNSFWSFLYLSSNKASSSSSGSSKKLNSKSFRDNNGTPRISAINAGSTRDATTGLCSAKLKDKCCSVSSLGRKSDIVVEEDNSPNSNTTASASSFERKVSRSRSVGCGSRSFSGDFFERISTGFGDCTLRRVESQREGKSKVSSGGGGAMNRGGDHHHNHHCMKERVRCGGIFSGFMMTSSSSSSSSSSYWVSSSADDAMNVKSGGAAAVAISHGRGRSWGWAFASPMRAFSGKPSSKENRRDIIRDANDKNAAPNLSAIPSLLAVRS